MTVNLNKTMNILSGTFILMMISFYNGYPLVYSDTGSYLYSGFDIYIPSGRPVIYGLLVNLLSLHISLWFVVLVQNLITAYLIFEICRFLIGKEKLTLYYNGIVFFLTAFTGIGWYTNQIIPDFFAPVFIMIIFLILYQEHISKWKYFFYALIFIIALMSHFSHMLISVLILLLAVIIDRLILRKKRQNYPGIKLPRLAIVAILIACSWILLPTINYIIEKQFIVSKGSHVFIMAHMVDTGLLKPFLKEKCNTDEYKDCKLCFYKDSIPNDLYAFLWDTKGIFKKTGGWNESEDEYNKIIRGMLTHPKYFSWNVFHSFTYGCTQLFKFNIGQGLIDYRENTGTYDQVKWRFPKELNIYLNSRQNKWESTDLDLKTLNIFNFLINIFCGFLLLYIFLSGKWKKADAASILFLMIVLNALVANAFTVTALNSPSSRFQARVMWLLPMALMIVYSRFFVPGRAKEDSDPGMESLG
jgi:hypothetical protein